MEEKHPIPLLITVITINQYPYQWSSDEHQKNKKVVIDPQLVKYNGTGVMISMIAIVLMSDNLSVTITLLILMS